MVSDICSVSKKRKAVQICQYHIICTHPIFKSLLTEYGWCANRSYMWIIKYASEEHKIHVYIPILRTQELCNKAYISWCNGQWIEEGNLNGEGIL